MFGGCQETGLDYFGARYFSGAQGRFTTPDWSSTPQAVPYADLHDPQSLNLYAYVRNNPMKNRDLDGHVCFFGIGNTCAASPPSGPKNSTPGLDTKSMLTLSRQPRDLSSQGAAFIRSYEQFRGQPYLPLPTDKPTMGMATSSNLVRTSKTASQRSKGPQSSIAMQPPSRRRSTSESRFGYHRTSSMH
jgi:RHS repeat-associated protein